MTHGSRPSAFVAMWPDSFSALFDESRLARLRSLCHVADPVTSGDLDDPDLADRLASVEVLLTSWGTPALTAERLDRMPKLKAVFHCAGTVRPMVSEAFWDRGILVTSAAEANAIPVAEFTFASIVLAGKRAQYFARDPRAHRREWRSLLDSPRMSNFQRSVGVVGFSRIGRRVVALLQQLDGAEVLVADPYADAAAIAAAGARLVSLDELLPSVDVLSLHAPALPETINMIGERELGMLRDGATVINTARGTLLDTDALAVECASGRLDAILDVTDPEPLPLDSPLFDLPNVSITPHIAGSLGTETFRLADAALDELERFLDGRSPLSAVTFADLGVSA
ncbi:hydroxyacid dehydrogenase [Agromyces albus]|uniref:hydroxyacid dehydrogenase n=1 Tax=Agromyces albus TaxID=205332 RepID=UPI002787BBF3|nr:hydroxyacid dehydrogenase [Agromyces albus]MDQ0573928.1 phosphoglycerate dehydrogenase-like enzyme [Agromyces albus]